MMILVAGVLGACGSMSVSDPYAEALPADFNAQEYLSLHPQLRVRQIKDFVADYNSQVKDSLGKEYDAVKKADDDAFLANTDMLGAIYMHPQIGGHTSDDWAGILADFALPDTSKGKKITRSMMAEYNFVGVADDASLLLSVPIDYQAVAQQYHVFGRDHVGHTVHAAQKKLLIRRVTLCRLPHIKRIILLKKTDRLFRILVITAVTHLALTV